MVSRCGLVRWSISSTTTYAGPRRRRRRRRRADAIAPTVSTDDEPTTQNLGAAAGPRDSIPRSRRIRLPSRRGRDAPPAAPSRSSRSASPRTAPTGFIATSKPSGRILVAETEGPCGLDSASSPISSTSSRVAPRRNVLVHGARAGGHEAGRPRGRLVQRRHVPAPYQALTREAPVQGNARGADF
jgi:hypothetical protein